MGQEGRAMSLQLSVQSADMDIGQVPHAQWPELRTCLAQRVSTFCRFVWFFAEIEIVIILTADLKEKQRKREKESVEYDDIYSHVFDKPPTQT